LSLIFDNLKALESDQEAEQLPPRPLRGQKRAEPIKTRARPLLYLAGGVAVMLLFGLGRLLVPGAGSNEVPAVTIVSHGTEDTVAATSSSSVPAAGSVASIPPLTESATAPAEAGSLAALSVQWPDVDAAAASEVAIQTEAETPVPSIDPAPSIVATEPAPPVVIAAAATPPVDIDASLALLPDTVTATAETEAGAAAISLTVRDVDDVDDNAPVVANISMITTNESESPVAIQPEPPPIPEPAAEAQPLVVEEPAPVLARVTTAAPARQSVEALRGQLLLALESGQYTQATLVLGQLQQQLGDDSGFYRRIQAYYLLRTEQLEAAEAAYDAILISSPEDGDARLNSGWLAMQRGDLNKARNRLRPLMTDSRYRSQATPLMAEIDRAARLGLQ